MKKGLIISILLGIADVATAQVHLKGQKYIELGGGLIDGLKFSGNQSGYFGSVSLGTYNRKENAWKLTVTMLQKNYGVQVTNNPATPLEIIPVRHYSLAYGYNFNLLRSRTRSAYLNVLAQGLVGYESINGDLSQIPDSKVQITNQSGMLVGGLIGLELELTDVMVLGIKEQWTPNAESKLFHMQIGISFRINR